MPAALRAPCRARAGLLSPAASPPASPSLASSRGGSNDTLRDARLQHASPVAERFRQAAVASDIVVQPGRSMRLSLQLVSSPAVTAGSDAAAGSASSGSSSPSGSGDAPQQHRSQDEADVHVQSLAFAGDSSCSGPTEPQAAVEDQQEPVPQEEPPSKLAAQASASRRQWSRSTSLSRPAASSRPSSANGGSTSASTLSSSRSAACTTDAAADKARAAGSVPAPAAAGGATRVRQPPPAQPLTRAKPGTLTGRSAAAGADPVAVPAASPPRCCCLHRPTRPCSVLLCRPCNRCRSTWSTH